MERGLQLQEKEFAKTQEKEYETAFDQFATQRLQQVSLQLRNSIVPTQQTGVDG